MTVRVVIADDQAVVRAGFAALLGAHEGIEVVGVASDGEALVELVLAQEPDVAVVDVRMPGVDGIAACRRISQAGSPTRVLVITTFDLDAYVYDALRAGASGFLLKDAPADQLVQAVRTVAEGSMLLGAGVTRRLVEDIATRRAAEDRGVFDGLTPREREITVHVARGLSNPEIAAAQSLSEQTVKSHVSEVLRKLGLRDRVQVVVLAYETGLVAPGTDTATQRGVTEGPPRRQRTQN